MLWLFGVLGLLGGQLTLAQTSSSPQSGAPYSTPHFLEYWSASRLLLQGGNPYSPVELTGIQQSVGWSRGEPVIMWNPPWSLLFTLPFGLLNFVAGQFCWLLFHVSLILFSVQFLWRIYGNPTRPSRLPWVLALTYVAAVFGLITEQISPVILAGLTAFLFFERKQQSFALGASVIMLSIKPHLLYLFWIVFLLWIWENRQWRVLLGTVLVGLSAAVVPLLFDPQIYFQYFALYTIPDIPRPLDWLTPTFRSAVRVFIGPGHTWLEFAPSIVAVAWVLYYWNQYKHGWQWRERLPLIVLVSVVSSFFAWTYDQVAFFPTIIEAAIWIGQKPLPWHAFWAARLYIAINACHAVLRIWVVDELWYFWLAPAFFANYLIFRWEVKKNGPL
jgi:hypothetical protein